jgi:hypothetical protein
MFMFELEFEDMLMVRPGEHGRVVVVWLGIVKAGTGTV